jgi:hypothetical protein
MDMDDIKEEVEELADDLRQHRDELRLQLHLAGAEAKESWEDLEKKWDRFEGKAALLRKEAKSAGGEIAAATKLLGSEIKEGYQRLRKLL